MGRPREKVCKRGHPKTPGNTIRTFNGRGWYAKCRACTLQRTKKYTRKRAAMTPTQKAAHAEASRRYRAENWQRVRAAEKRYRATARGKQTMSEGARRYAKTPKGKATSRRLYLKAYADSAKRAKIIARNKRWRKANPHKWRAAHEHWLKTTPAGRKYQERHSFGLPAHAHGSLIATCRLLRALQQEMKHEHKRA